ncbi:LETM1 domain-containing protein 1 isoform X1 [Pangasianodon hypophthalmus]|uniref:LETM1 domain-containing protein 1 isoform X1 n=1 Tax=Pangasianodon hypophthalmus TaxID=310915 RepID=UPI00230816B8|nr:LETM1 domain-containing protein 1 isoform X1 [Pangasianodon hypophthalmus]
MFRLCRRAVFIHEQWIVKVNLPLSPYSTSPVRLGVLRKANEKCERFLEQRFPRFSILYHTLRKGFRLLLEDVKEVSRIKRTIWMNNMHYRELPYRELKRLILFRRDMVKAIPLLVISLPPFAIGLVLILMCLFPRQLLFRHFWTPQQQRKFQMIDHIKRSQCQAKILDSLVLSVPRVSAWHQRSLLNLCSKVQGGKHPRVSEVRAVRDVFFESSPLGLQRLEPRHLRLLGSQLPVIVWFPSFLVRRRLTTKALGLLYLDRALQRLGLDQLTEEEMRQACDFRGLNPSRLTSSECTEWLHQWLELSAKVKESEISLLLHSMTLLTLNYPPVTK